MGSIFLSVLLTPKSYGDNAMSPEDTCTSGVLLSERNLWSRACYIFFFNSQIIYSKFSYKKGNYPIFYIQNNFDTGEKKEGLLWSLGKHLKSRLELLVGLLSQSKTWALGGPRVSELISHLILYCCQRGGGRFLLQICRVWNPQGPLFYEHAAYIVANEAGLLS